MLPSLSRRHLPPAAALLLVLAACDSGTAPQDPGSVDLTISTSGRVLDAVAVDGTGRTRLLDTPSVQERLAVWQ